MFVNFLEYFVLEIEFEITDHQVGFRNRFIETDFILPTGNLHEILTIQKTLQTNSQRTQTHENRTEHGGYKCPVKMHSEW